MFGDVKAPLTLKLFCSGIINGPAENALKVSSGICLVFGMHEEANMEVAPQKQDDPT